MIRALSISGVEYLEVGSKLFPLSRLGPLSMNGENVMVHFIGIGDVVTDATESEFDAYVAAGSEPSPASVMRVGNGPPLVTTGQNGDAYTDLLTGDIYQKQNSTWL